VQPMTASANVIAAPDRRESFNLSLRDMAPRYWFSAQTQRAQASAHRHTR